MNRKKGILVLAALVLLGACTTNGPEGALNKMAKAMDENNPGAFMAQIDLPVYTENYIQNLTRNDSALSSLNEIGNILGLGQLDNLIGSIVDFRAHIEQNFEEGIASGELMAQCKVATTPDCPWYPASLREAQIVEINPNAAIARVTTPARLTSWLALRREGENWRVVGVAVLEKNARAMAVKDSQASGSAPASRSDNSGKAVNI